MLKCNVKVNGVITGQASLRTANDGKSYVTFNLKVNVPGSRNNMPGKEIRVSVSKRGNQGDVYDYTSGKRIEIEGILTFRKSNDNLYFNLKAENVNFFPEESKDLIEGTLEFKGKLGNKIDEKSDKNGNSFVIFSGFSTEKVKEEFQFIWVRFVKFKSEREAFMTPKAKIQATGSLEVNAYNGKINLECVCDNVVLQNQLPFPPAKDGEEAAF